VVVIILGLFEGSSPPSDRIFWSISFLSKRFVNSVSSSSEESEAGLTCFDGVNNSTFDGLGIARGKIIYAGQVFTV